MPIEINDTLVSPAAEILKIEIHEVRYSMFYGVATWQKLHMPLWYIVRLLLADSHCLFWAFMSKNYPAAPYMFP